MAQVPVVEMLWEAEEPAEVLRTRFDFDGAAAAAGWVAATLAEHWGVEVDACRRVVMSDHNALAWVATSLGPMLAKWSVAPQRFPALAEVASLSA